MVNYREKLDIDFDLSHKQIEILERNDDTLVRALPGSGKTTILTLKIKNLLLDNPKINKVCCISYTNVNVEDLKIGCTQIIGHDLLQKVEFLTFHSFCLQYILRPFSYLYRSNKGLRPYKKIFNFDEHGTLLINYLRKEKIENTDIEIISNNKSVFYNFKSVGETWRPVSNNIKAKTLAKYLSFLNLNKLIDFNLINLLSLFIVQKNTIVQKALNKSMDWVFIDEFQDISEIQCKIIETISANRENKNSDTKWFMVGDPNQSIYGFAGANPRSMYDMRVFFNNLHDGINCEVKLEKSHRCSDQVFEFAKKNYNSILNQIKNSKPIQEFGNAQISGYLNDLEISNSLKGNGDCGQVIIKTTGSGVDEIINIKFNELDKEEVCCIGINKFNSIDVYKQYRLHRDYDSGEGFSLYAEICKDFEDKYGFKYFSLFIRYLVLKHHFYYNRIKYSKSVNKFIYFLDLIISEKLNKEVSVNTLEGITTDAIDILSPLKEDKSILGEFSSFSERLIKSLKKNLELTEAEQSIFKILTTTEKIEIIKDTPEPLVKDFISHVTRTNFEKLAFEIKHIHKIKGLEYEHVIVQKIEDLPYRHWENALHHSIFNNTQYNPSIEEIYNYIQEINKLYVMLTRPRKNLYIIRDNKKSACFLPEEQ